MFDGAFLSGGQSRLELEGLIGAPVAYTVQGKSGDHANASFVGE